jgi:glycosyltransferase involved in cell wall biosynthesis
LVSIGILSFANYPVICGTDERVFELSKHLVKHNANVSLIINITGEKPRLSSDFTLVDHFTTRFGVLSDLFFTIIQLLNLLKQGRLDVIQIELYNIKFSLFFLLISKLFSNKTSIVIHDKRVGVKKPIDSYFIIPALKLVNTVIFVDADLQHYVSTTFGQWISKKSIIIKNSATLPEIEYNDIMTRNKYGFDKNDFIVTFVGSSLFGPNVHAIETIHQVSRKYRSELEDKKIKFLIVDSSYDGRTLNDNVTKIGYVEDIFEILSISDIGLAPMTPTFTGSHIKVLYYMASGTPVLTTEDGIKGIIGVKNNKNVLLYNELDEMIDQIIRLYDDRKLLRFLGDASKQLIVNNYTWDKSAKRLVSHYLSQINMNSDKIDET